MTRANGPNTQSNAEFLDHLQIRPEIIAEANRWAVIIARSEVLRPGVNNLEQAIAYAGMRVKERFSLDDQEAGQIAQSTFIDLIGKSEEELIAEVASFWEASRQELFTDIAKLGEQGLGLI